MHKHYNIDVLEQITNVNDKMYYRNQQMADKAYVDDNRYRLPPTLPYSMLTGRPRIPDTTNLMPKCGGVLGCYVKKLVNTTGEVDLRLGNVFVIDAVNGVKVTISNAIKDDAELARFWETMKERPELKIMFNQTKDLSPKAIQQVIRIIKAIEDEEDREDG